VKRAVVLLALSFAGCECGVPGVSNDIYACTTTADCNEDQVCANHVCSPKGTPTCPVVDCTVPACESRFCAPNGKVCSAGACICSGNGGTVQTTETDCTDGHDNDCNGQTDCADSACDGKACGGGGTCSNGVCLCAAAGNKPQAVESYCNDGLDNDCNGLTDCADPSCNNQTCATNGKVCSADAGTCVCGGNGGTVQTTETICNDGADNDCNGKTDCAEPSCDMHPCKPNGFTCMGVTCTCTGNGGTPQPAGEMACSDGFDNDCNGLTDCADPSCAGASCGTGCACAMGMKTETNCGDGMDNDGDGLTDCADPDCSGIACGMNGLTCTTSACRCLVDGGTVQMMESICNDGLDNDCNGLTDCQESACVGQVCGTAGQVCGDAGTCLCTGGGGPLEMPEMSCMDGFDNDCNGLIDCADPACAGTSCGAGCTCNNGKHETNCSDGIDNDGDGVTDCMDSDCTFKSCSASATASVCCGIGTNATMCKNLATDSSNCGGCGAACHQGSCQAASASGVPSGRCTCGGNQKCPGGLTQTCNGGTCACSSAADCEPGQQCGGGVCHY
jgi:hypothetical protein